MANRRGRPLKEDAKRGSIHFRLGENETNMLNELSEKTGKNRTEIFTNLLGKEYKRVMHNSICDPGRKRNSPRKG